MTRPPLDTVRESRRTPWWQILAWAVAVVLVVTGLAALALFVFVASSAHSFGANK